MDEDRLAEIRHVVATGCRILASEGLAENILGHISVRVDEEHAVVRCRGPHEQGLLFTTPEAVRVVRLADGAVDDPAYAVPNELPIHREVLRSRGDVMCVVHAHPPEVVAADLADLTLVPMVGAYDIPAAKLAAEGIPVYPRGVLISSVELAREMVESLGGHAVCVLRGHGLTSTGTSVQQAVLRALHIQSLARMALAVRAAGATPRPLPAADLALLPDLGGGFNETLLWRHHVARLRLRGLAL